MAQLFPRFLTYCCLALADALSTSVRHWCGKAGVDDPRSGLIPVLRLAFGLYLQRRELDKGAGGDEAAPWLRSQVSRSGAAERPNDSLVRLLWVRILRKVRSLPRSSRAKACRRLVSV